MLPWKMDAYKARRPLWLLLLQSRPAQVSGKLELGTWRESRLVSFNQQGFQFLGEIYNVDAVIKDPYLMIGGS